MDKLAGYGAKLDMEGERIAELAQAISRCEGHQRELARLQMVSSQSAGSWPRH
jgi:hypothetical protein